ncbi:MAG: hypothetical protein WBK76_00480 [Candidatus Saccharimonadales bacterium]
MKKIKSLDQLKKLASQKPIETRLLLHKSGTFYSRKTIRYRKSNKKKWYVFDWISDTTEYFKDDQEFMLGSFVPTGIEKGALLLESGDDDA